ncbi:MAG: 2-phospho-L-lactate guanylyltransferase [Oceanospirillaceae bacterium]
MTLCIVIPMKDPQCSKQRLSDVLDPHERQNIALNLLHKTLQFLTQHFPRISVLIVTPATVIAKIAEQYKVSVLIEQGTKGLNNAIVQAAQHCEELGFTSQLVLPADIIDLDYDEFKQLLNLKRPRESVIICPADDGGTNALLTSPPRAIEFSYGLDSSRKHWRNAQQNKVHCQLLTLPNLALDLDTAQDLQLLSADVINQLTHNNHHHHQLQR